jgi:hypothetical protein
MSDSTGWRRHEIYLNHEYAQELRDNPVRYVAAACHLGSGHRRPARSRRRAEPARLDSTEVPE